MQLSHSGPTPAPTLAVSAETLRGVLLWLMAFAGAFVFIEPSPYEVVGLLIMYLLCVSGLTLQAPLMPLALLLIVLNLGDAVAMVQVAGDPKAVTWIGISIFLGLTGVFYAAIASVNTQERLDYLLSGYVAAAVISSIVAIGGYFHLFGGLSGLFVLYDRARGTFNDPNVLGAFLVLPAALMFQRILTGRISVVLRSGFLLAIMLVALLLTFSRAAWGQLVFSCVIVMALALVTARSARTRARIILVGILGALLAAVLVAALLSIHQVSDLFSERATLDQSYDLGHFGRFGRYVLGAELGLEHPLGIGPLQFYKFFGEDPHNTFLNEFMSGGWLAGFAYLTLTAITLTNATRFLRADTPWRSTYQVIYAGYVGVSLESAIIDIDHWRHYFLILGALWGMMAASRPYLAASAAIRDRGSLSPVIAA